MKKVSLHTIVNYLENELRTDLWPDDPSKNGLQYEGRNMISRFACAVDACDATFDMANAVNADFLFVHHGISWGTGIPRVNGIIGRRVTKLATSGLSLFAAHLPLDTHPVLGHNILLADIIGLKKRVPFGSYHGHKIGFLGNMPKALTADNLIKLYDDKLPSHGPIRLMHGDANRKFRKIAIISGGGAWPDLFEECVTEGVECLITGEATHECFHPSKEAGVEVISLGHYRSETPGVIAVGKLISEKFGLEYHFLDHPTGM